MSESELSLNLLVSNKSKQVTVQRDKWIEGEEPDKLSIISRIYKASQDQQQIELQYTASKAGIQQFPISSFGHSFEMSMRRPFTSIGQVSPRGSYVLPEKSISMKKSRDKPQKHKQNNFEHQPLSSVFSDDIIPSQNLEVVDVTRANILSSSSPLDVHPDNYGLLDMLPLSSLFIPMWFDKKKSVELFCDRPRIRQQLRPRRAVRIAICVEDVFLGLSYSKESYCDQKIASMYGSATAAAVSGGSSPFDNLSSAINPMSEFHEPLLLSLSLWRSDGGGCKISETFCVKIDDKLTPPYPTCVFSITEPTGKEMIVLRVGRICDGENEKAAEVYHKYRKEGEYESYKQMCETSSVVRERIGEYIFSDFLFSAKPLFSFDSGSKSFLLVDNGTKEAVHRGDGTEKDIMCLLCPLYRGKGMPIHDTTIL
ncbi:hypothetical protein ADUPG1_007897, partial [Aduncisulcus paluster]